MALLCFGIVKAQLPSDGLMEQIVLKVSSAPAPADYGTSPDAPVYVGAYKYLADNNKMAALMGHFYKTYVWSDGTQIVFSKPATVMGKFGNVDVYTIVQTGKKDTMKLYVDMFKEGQVFLPAGLKLYTKEQLSKELAPVIQEVKTYNAVPDNYSDSTSKATAFQLVAFLQRNIGLDYLLDKETLKPVLDDANLDLDFRAYLVRSYMFHKLEFAYVDAPKTNEKAFNAMLGDFNKIYKLHPTLKSGAVATLKPKA